MLTPKDNLLDYVDDYVHGLLSPEDARLVERFCENSKLGQAAMADAHSRYQAMQQLPPAEASEQLIRATLDDINTKVTRRQRRRKRYVRSVLLVTAASALFISVLNIYYYGMKPSPYDLRLLGQSQLLAGSEASLRIAVSDRSNGNPVPNVPVRVALYNPATQEEVELASLRTNVSGVAGPDLHLPDWQDGSYQLRVVARPGGSEEFLERSIELRREWQLMLSTDKPVYQPGQAIRLRSLALRKPDRRPVAGEEVTFTITDPSGNMIFKQRDVSSRFGIASADCPLDREIRVGEYQIRCTVGSTNSEQTVKIEKYVLPKFKITVSLDKPYYAPGERVTGQVQADYFFGKPVTGGEVRIEVQTQDIGPQKLAAMTRQTDDSGHVEFDFRLPDRMVGREQDSGMARFQVAVQVTDTAGQTGTAGASRVVTAQPILLDIIPENGRLVQAVDNRIYIVATYADGRPCQARLAINGQDEIETDQLGIAEIEIYPASDLELIVKAIDAEGRIGRRTVKMAISTSGYDFLVRPDKAVYRGGETMQLTVLADGSPTVFVDLVKDGQTILAQTLDVLKGAGGAEIDLPPELSGTVEINAYSFGAHGLAVRKTRVVYVEPANQLGIQATFDQQEYRPGQQAKIKLRLTDSDGNPAPGAISLKAVDEAVYAVLSQKSNMEETFFLLEQELLEPVYTVYPGWSPQLFSELPTLERERFQQALFARTVQQAEGLGAVPLAFCGISEQIANVPNPMPDGGILRNPFTLAAASYPAKLQEVLATRDAGLHLALAAWGALAAGLVLACIVGFGIFYPKAFLITAAVCFGMSCLVTVPLGLLATWTATARFEAVGGAMPGMVAADGAAAEWGDDAGWGMEAMDSPMEDASGAFAAAPIRVRQWFPETLLWRPELITDDNGEVTLDVDLADSITTWRLSGSAVTADGRLGGAEFPIKVFQPFFVDFDLPVALTRNDQVGIPVVVYNYLDQAQTIRLEIERAEWFEWLADTGGSAAKLGDESESDSESPSGSASQDDEPILLSLELASGEVRSIRMPIRVRNVGLHTLQVTARGSDIADAVQREIEVVAGGTPEETVASGNLLMPFEQTLSVPDDAIPGSVSAVIKVYPSSFSQLVEGLDAIFAMPHGCFEQTSSTTYPNILALDYLRRTGKSVPEVEAKARQYIHLGYQRLITFEVPGGGFDWFGNPPANRTLTAYGLLEFEDMNRVHEVDPKLIARTRSWLLQQRNPDGSWSNEAGMLDDGLAGSVQRGRQLDVAATAYTAWAVFGNGKADGAAELTRRFLLAHPPADIQDPYVLALTINALIAMDTSLGELAGHIQRLESLKQTGPEGKVVWWQQNPDDSTVFYGSGQAGDIETTAMATLALLAANQHPQTARAALQWLVQQKDSRGTWHSTQATVLALKALLAGTDKPLGDSQERSIEIQLGGETYRKLVIPPDQSEVLQQVSLSEVLVPGNDYQVRLIDRSNSATGFQLTFRYHHESEPAETTGDASPLSVDVSYDRTRLNVDETVTAVARVTNRMQQTAPMVILDLPIPGGFTIDVGELDELVGSRVIARYQLTPRQAIVYLRALQSGQSLELRYRLRATMPVKVAVPDAQVYEYYDPSKRGSGGATRLEANEA